MGTNAIALYTACAILALSMAFAGAVVMWRQSQQSARVAARIQAVREGGEVLAARAPVANGQSLLLGIIGRFGRALAGSGVLPAKTLDELQVSLATAGLRGGGGLGVFIGGKVVLMVGLGVLGWVFAREAAVQPTLMMAMPLGGALGGMLLPDIYLKQMRKRHLKQVEAGLPDALDMLVICSEAGLGLEPAIERVAVEIGSAHPAMAEELATAATELRIIADRRQVLLNMGTRTGLDTVRRLASTLIQTTQFGTPLSQALRTLATEMRQEALTRFEARAARLPVLLTVPMIIFILPCIFVIVGGPAALQLTEVLGKK